MSLPTSVQQAEEQANAMIQGNTAQATSEQAPTQTPPQVNETPQAPQATSDDNVDWKARYQVLQGKYNAEVPTLQDKVKSLEKGALAPNESDAQLRQEIETLRQQLEQAKQQTVAETKPTLNAHLVEEYGEEFAKAVASTAQSQVQAVRDEFDQRFNQHQQDLSSMTTESKMRSVKASLASNGINFDQVDPDPLFHDWLSQADEWSGQSRQALMMQAFESGELDRVVRFYTAYVDSTKTRTAQHPFSEHVQPQNIAMQDTGAQRVEFNPQAFEELHRRYQRGLMSDEEFVKAEREMYSALNQR